MSHFSNKFHQTDNCVFVSQYFCDNCEGGFLTDYKGAVKKCPSCGKTLEAQTPLVIARTECKHDANLIGHEYRGV